MSKQSTYQRNLKRIKLSTIYLQRRLELKQIIKNKNSTPEKKLKAVFRLQTLRRDSSPVRVVTRCYISGRSKSVLKKFGISRICFRDLALRNLLPGVEKSSW